MPDGPEGEGEMCPRRLEGGSLGGARCTVVYGRAVLALGSLGPLMLACREHHTLFVEVLGTAKLLVPSTQRLTRTVEV